MRIIISRWVVMTLVVLLTACATTPPPASRTNEAQSLIDGLNAARELAQAYDPEDILVIFDLDNTLLAMNTDFGSDQWYQWQKTLRDEPGCVPERVPDILKVQGAAYYSGSMHPTQADTAAIIRRLQEEEFRVIVLTSRGVDFRLVTFRELRRNGLDFTPNAIPIDEESRFGSLTYIPKGSDRPVHYEDGVFMVAGHHKGKMLESLLTRTGWTWPKAVVAMDDTADKISALEDSLDPLGIPYRLYRYGGEDARVAAFNPDQAARDWQRVAPALSQLEAVFGAVNYELPNPLMDPACVQQP